MTEKSGITRKQQILETAFSLVQIDNRWSLAKVASKIGVSKTAIYRHFKNKAEIEEAMSSTLREDILAEVEKSEFTPNSLRKNLVAFFRSHPGHLFMIMYNNLTTLQAENQFFKYLEIHSAKIAGFTRIISGLKQSDKEKIHTSLLKNCVSVFIASFQVDGIRDLQDTLLEVLEKGLPQLARPTDTRLGELETMCVQQKEKSGDRAKLFDAIAETIKEYGISDTTIEHIAKKMGTAKSSLYFYFSNKNEMLHELVKKETDTIIALCAKHASEGKTLAEQLFIIMETQANYLLMNPNIIPVFNWIRYETIQQTPVAEHIDCESKKNIEPYLIQDLLLHEMSIEGKVNPLFALGLLKWASILSASTIIQGLKQNETESALKSKIKTMFISLLEGDRLTADLF